MKDKVIAGTAGGEFGVRGFIAAWDVKTGKEVWRFNTVPGPGEPGHETWGGDSWMHGGAPIWVTGSYDPELNLTYWGTGNPGPDWDGAGRLGDNLYSCSVIALDPDTGTLKWHYQFSPHNEFDWDSTQIPVLADMDWQGKPRKVMLWANRNGMSYVLDRAHWTVPEGAAIRESELGRWLRRQGPADPRARHRSDQGRHARVSGQSGRARTGTARRTARAPVCSMCPTWENTSTTYIKGDTPPEFKCRRRLHRTVPACRSQPPTTSTAASRRSIRRRA